MCGENSQYDIGQLYKHGTSPHVWGKRNGGDEAAERDRNIPTCVGKTTPPHGGTVARPEHPHMCGENIPAGVIPPSSIGTSPHVWGKHGRLFGHGSIDRNIPTCVGKTLRSDFGRGLVPEHPHMCGENSRSGVAVTPSTGTSPHVWGKQFVVAADSVSYRNIPTCVGKTSQAP